MKRLFAIVIVLALALSACLTACAPAQPAPAPADPAPADSAPADSAPADSAPADSAPADSPAAPADGEMLKIGYCCNNLNDTFQTYIVDVAKEFAAANNIELTVVDGQDDIVKQQDAVNGLIAQGVQGLIIVPVDTSSVDPMNKAAADAGIPVCYVNRHPYDGKEDQMPDHVYYVGSNSIDSGVMQMEYLGEKAGGEGGVCILQGQLSNEASLARTEGNKQVINEKYPKMEVMAEDTGNWQRDQGVSITENWITTYGDKLKVIASNNDEMALGALRACEQLNRTDIIIGGIDGIPDALTSIEEGKLACSVFQDAAGQGNGAMTTIQQALTGGTPEKVTWVPYQLITPENVADFK